MSPLTDGRVLNILKWRPYPPSKKPANYGWADEAYDDYGEVHYILYHDTEKHGIFLKDIKNGEIYNTSSENKVKGYLLAFKLNNLRTKKKK